MSLLAILRCFILAMSIALVICAVSAVIEMLISVLSYWLLMQVLRIPRLPPKGH
jgi:hypothetical protein